MPSSAKPDFLKSVIVKRGIIHLRTGLQGNRRPGREVLLQGNDAVDDDTICQPSNLILVKPAIDRWRSLGKVFTVD